MVEGANPGPQAQALNHRQRLMSDVNGLACRYRWASCPLIDVWHAAAACCSPGSSAPHAGRDRINKAVIKHPRMQAIFDSKSPPCDGKSKTATGNVRAATGNTCPFPVYLSGSTYPA
jgi:hypothetical protein